MLEARILQLTLGDATLRVACLPASARRQQRERGSIRVAQPVRQDAVRHVEGAPAVVSCVVDEDVVVGRGVGVQRRVGKPPPPGGGRGGALLLVDGVRSFTPETTILSSRRRALLAGPWSCKSWAGPMHACTCGT